MRVERAGEGWTLLRGGKPYAIKGVGGVRLMADLVAAGGNSMRNWGVGDDTRAIHEEAQTRGVTIMQGIWLGHKSYFDYNDAQKVADQKAMVLREVANYKNSPALLIWGIGNEMDINNDTPELWKAIESIIKDAKKVDPNHPFATVVAEVSAQKIANIKRYVPSLDILGVNSYGGLDTLPKRLKEFGWTKPYVLTEWGPNGSWEVAKTAFGMPVEPNTTEKADFFRRRYRDVMVKAGSQLLGGYAFVWDSSKEIPGWFGTFLPSDIRTEQVDALQEIWSGKAPAYGSPRIVSATCDAAGKTIAPNAMISARITLKDPNDDPLSYRWEVRRDAGDSPYGGQGPEPQPSIVDGPADKQNGSAARFAAPGSPGKYRVYVRAFDGRGNGASANWPFEVK